MFSEENKAIVRRYLEAAWNQKDRTVVDHYIAPDLIQYVRNVPSGWEGIKQFFAMIYSSFPDTHSLWRISWLKGIRGCGASPWKPLIWDRSGAFHPLAR